MANSESQNPYPREWTVKYRAAISSQTNSPEMKKRLSDAEDAIVQRMRELFRDTGVDVEGGERRSGRRDVRPESFEDHSRAEDSCGLTCLPSVDASRQP